MGPDPAGTVPTGTVPADGDVGEGDWSPTARAGSVGGAASAQAIKTDWTTRVREASCRAPDRVLNIGGAWASLQRRHMRRSAPAKDMGVSGMPMMSMKSEAAPPEAGGWPSRTLTA